LQVESDVLRVIDAATGKPVLFRSEQIEEMKQQAAKDKKLARLEKKRADEQKQLAKMESKRADALEREVARLKALTKNKGESHGV
jgi:hypothetical protein